MEHHNLWFNLSGSEILDYLQYVRTVYVDSPIGFVRVTKKEFTRRLVWRQRSYFRVEYNAQVDYFAIHNSI